jgi:hypothetical protein
MLVSVNERRMKMPMTMPEPSRHHQIRLVWMVMLMMLVMNMLVLMGHRLVRMFVMMALSQMQPDTNTHQNPGAAQLPSQRFARQDSKRRSNKRRD